MNSQQVCAYLGVSRPTIHRWEHGRNAPNIGNVRALAQAYDASPAELSRMTSLAEQGNVKGIWEGAKVPYELRALYESESSAHMIRTVELDYIPGLLQTPEYMVEAQKVASPRTDDENREIRETFARRQAVMFTGETSGPTMKFVFGQSALLYLREHPEVYDAQVARLREMSRWSNVEIRVLTRLHPAMTGAFTIIDADPDGIVAPFAFLEALDGCRYVETPDVVSQYDQTWEQVWDVAIPLEEYLNDTWKVA